MKGRVLVIEDDRDIALSIRTVLTRNGFDVASSDDGKEGLRAFHVKRPDLVVLDIGLPTLDGWSVLERIRDLSDVPVLILTAHGREADKVRGLYGGADDYLTKPFGNGELAARVEALLRRPRATQAPAQVYDDGRLVVNFEAREVSADGAPVSLTPIEFRLLTALIRRPGQILTPEQLLELAWNDPLGIGPERVKFAVMRLRRKLGQEAGPGAAIEAVRGFGYRYAVPLEDPARGAPADRVERATSRFWRFPPAAVPRGPRRAATVLHRGDNGDRQAPEADWAHEHEAPDGPRAGQHGPGRVARADPDHRR